MTREDGDGKRRQGGDELDFGGTLTPRGHAVVAAFLEARKASTGFLLSCGLLPEVSESCTEGMHHHVHRLADGHFARKDTLERLDGVLRGHGLSDSVVESINHEITELLAADTTAAYLFGLAAGLGLGSLDRRLSE